MTKTCIYCGTEIIIETLGDGWNEPSEFWGTCSCCDSEYEEYNGKYQWHQSVKAAVKILKRFLFREEGLHHLRLELGIGSIMADITGYEVDGEELYLHTSALNDELILPLEELEFLPEQEELVYQDYVKNIKMILF